MSHRFPDQTIPEPKPGAREEGDMHEKDEEREPDVTQRPPLPDHDRPPARQRG
jgi:hypothetical protein